PRAVTISGRERVARHARAVVAEDETRPAHDAIDSGLPRTDAGDVAKLDGGGREILPKRFPRHAVRASNEQVCIDLSLWRNRGHRLSLAHRRLGPRHIPRRARLLRHVAQGLA